MGKIIVTAILFLASASVSAGWFGPDNYDDCVLEKMKGQETKAAIIHARKACRKKFPEKPKFDFGKYLEEKPTTRLDYSGIFNE